MIHFTLPYPPSGNRHWRRNRGRTHISREGRAYHRAVADRAAEERIEALTGRLSVEVIAYPPDRRKRDIDNLWKPLLDSLEVAGVIEDDGMIDDLRIRRGERVDGGCVVVRIEELTE